ncbi:nose resistant to fluoxetine protein 6-like [Pecten maximus]|uniref:nose resistant to fluoxetine protein 6-like n=1 Tax=Pecten maximus TaxID=6579 RepID=UPI001459109E|nr:nose resistant to fluoxetine protein 6-like [Pecten maximus]
MEIFGQIGLLCIMICCIGSHSQNVDHSNVKSNQRRYPGSGGDDLSVNSKPTNNFLSSTVSIPFNVKSRFSSSYDQGKGKTSSISTPVSNYRTEYQSSSSKELDAHDRLFPTEAHIQRNGMLDRTTTPVMLQTGTKRYRRESEITTNIGDKSPGQQTTMLQTVSSVSQSNSNNLSKNTLQRNEVQRQLGDYVTANNATLSSITQGSLVKVIDALLQHAVGNDTAFLQLLFGSLNGMSLPPDILKKLGMLYGNTDSIDLNDIMSHLSDEQKKFFADFIIQQLSPISTVCLDHLSELIKDNVTALKMIDASGKPPTAVLQGNLKWTGSFDECLALKDMGRGPRTFDGKYCTATVSLEEVLTSVMDGYPAEAEIGLCVPDTCNRYEVKFFADLMLGLAPLGNISLHSSDMTCHETAGYDALAVATILFFASLGMFILFATIMDIRYIINAKMELKDMAKANVEAIGGDFHGSEHDTTRVNNTGIRARLLVSFSLYTNGRNLLSSKRPRGSFGAVNGIRFLSISWVILGHTFIHLSSSGSMENQLTFVPKFLHQWSAGVLVNSLLSVDTFFTLSGLLLSYVFMKEMKRLKGQINWFMFYLHRIWRLTPPYMLVMFIYVALLRYTGDGPLWQKNGYEKDFCAKTWWRNLLYINNFIGTNNSCMVWTWYLANDMQFYLISPLLLVPLYYSRRLGGLVCCVVLLGVTVTSYVVSYQLNLPAVMFTADPKSINYEDDYFLYYFVRPYCRMGPYIVGIMAGYMLFVKERNFKINGGLNALTWFLMTLLGAVVTFGVHGPVTGAAWTPGIAALYNATHSTIWGVYVSWIVFACVTGHGGFINTLLSWKAFVPLGRLTYCVYLVHPILLYYYTATTRQTIYVTNYTLIYIYLGTLVFSHLLAFLTSLVFEAPMRELEKVIFKRKRK